MLSKLNGAFRGHDLTEEEIVREVYKEVEKEVRKLSGEEFTSAYQVTERLRKAYPGVKNYKWKTPVHNSLDSHPDLTPWLNGHYVEYYLKGNG